MDRLGLGWEQLSAINPKLIYCSITGFGPDGPYRHRPAYDTVVQALSGLLGQFLEPDRPRITGPNVADAVTGLYAAYGVLGALYEREKSGHGHLVEVPMLDAVISFATNSIAQFFRNGQTPSPYQRPAASQCFVLPCADGKLIAVHLSTPPKFWEALLEVIERPELAADAASPVPDNVSRTTMRCRKNSGARSRRSRKPNGPPRSNAWTCCSPRSTILRPWSRILRSSISVPS